MLSRIQQQIHLPTPQKVVIHQRKRPLSLLLSESKAAVLGCSLPHCCRALHQQMLIEGPQGTRKRDLHDVSAF